MTRTLRVLAVLLLPALVLSGCGTEEKDLKTSPTTPAPTSDVTVPAGVTLTKPGVSLHFGQPATVADDANSKRNTVLQLTVTSVSKGAIGDFAQYVLDARTRQSTPYYVHVQVKNVGEGDVGKTSVPLWAVDQTNTLIQSSNFPANLPFTKCPSQALPSVFGPKAALNTCLAYLVPDHGTLTQVSFRPLQSAAPITWSGKLSTPVVPHKTIKPGNPKTGKPVKPKK